MTHLRARWRRLASLGLVAALAMLAHAHEAWAHEARPAYLEVTETAPDRYQVLWRTPILSGMRLPVLLKLPDEARNVSQPALREFSDSLIERRAVEVPGGLAGKRIDFPGLQATITDVLARVQLRDGGYSTTLVHPSHPWIDIAAAQGKLSVAGAYLRHGVEHILLGYDHLLFVLALILIVRSMQVLLWTVTAFTVAHSITLALATLGAVHVPGPPVEACIAFSILLLAAEIVRLQRGESSLTARLPWVVAFCFGLLHGLGFASALSDIGLPRGDIPLALFAFNVGVELGQLAFIAAVLGFVTLVKRLEFTASLRHRVLRAVPFGIGALAAFWFFDRLAGF